MIRELISQYLLRAGIRVDGAQTWDMRVKNPRVFSRAFWRGSLGLGEAYMAGWWDCECLDEFFYHLVLAGGDRRFRFQPAVFWQRLSATLQSRATVARAFALGKFHYDLGNDLFGAMLGSSMAYTCAYWEEGARSLDESQQAKFKLTCDKLLLKPGMKVLDIGCGFGGLAAYMANLYGGSVVGITVSKEQLQLGRETCRGLPVELRLQDYRELSGEKFDRIVSLGMFEHVAPGNYTEFMRIVHDCLAPGGVFLLHTIGTNFAGPTDPWIRRYIFPVGDLPTETKLRRSAGELFNIRDWHRFGQSYDRTLMAWYENFLRAWPQLEASYGHMVGGRFKRMWEYYLCCCAGAFRADSLDLWQIVMTRKGEEVEYQPFRQRETFRATV